MASNHQQDDIRGNFVLKIGDVKEEKTYFKVRVGNNPEDVVNMKSQIKEECGQSADSRSIWAYFGNEMASLPAECKFKSKEGGVWVNFAKADAEMTQTILDSFPPKAFPGELFVELSMTSDKSFKDGFYNSFNFRVSLDGSHEFAQNFGIFLVKMRKFPIHEKLLLNIIKKFSSFDIMVEFDTLDSLNKDLAQEMLLDDTSLQNGAMDILIGNIKRSTSVFADSKELAIMITKGIRIVAFANENMYVNVELKGEDAIHFLQS